MRQNKFRNQIKLCVVIVFLSCFSLFGQEYHPETEHHDEEHDFRPHKIALVTAYGFIPGSIDENGEEINRVIPVLGLDYEYWFNHKFGVGLHTDLELSSYTIQDDDLDLTERHYAFVLSTVFLYEPFHGLAVYAGPGRELEKNHSFNLLRIGADYTKTFDDGWGVGVVLYHDFKEIITDCTTLGIVVSRRFGK